MFSVSLVASLLASAPPALAAEPPTTPNYASSNRRALLDELVPIETI